MRGMRPKRSGWRSRRRSNGAEVFIIANSDTVMSRSNEELMAEVFPAVPLKDGTGANETLLSIAKARRLLGYEPQHGWRRA